MLVTKLALLAEDAVSDKKDLYPHATELIFGAVAFGIIYVFMWKWVIPRMNKLLEERREKIQGEMERAEATRGDADKLLADYKAQLASARDEGNRIIEEARQTADQLRVDLQARAEQESQSIVARAQEEIRAERDRVFQELRTQVAQIAVELAGKVVGETLDTSAHTRLIDEYIDQVTSGNGNN
ncbi:MAG: F0F1 ATP synthase subunit B [Actinomycetota bacterium]